MSSSISDSDISDLLLKIDRLKQAVPNNEETRMKLYDAARSLMFATESPGDSIQRIAYSPLPITIARIASDIRLLEVLAEKGDKQLSTADLADVTKTDRTLLGRILRCLASFGMVSDNGEDLWSANNITKTLSVPGLKAGIFHNHDLVIPCLQELPEFLAETNYRNPSDGLHTSFHKRFKTDLAPFLWVQDKPTYLTNFGLWMTASRESQNLFLDVFPFEKEVTSPVIPETLFVDVGGGVGHQCALLKQRLPHLPGRVILQDLPQVVAQAIPTEGVEVMQHDFTTEQPIKGAKAYYLRNIMHDYADQKCIHILQQIIKAMNNKEEEKESSVILIDEMVIPNRGANWHATQLDITMMAGLAGMERTERQWHALLDKAGLRIRAVYPYTPELRDSIIVAVLK